MTPRFCGSDRKTLDDKNRLMIPAKFKDELLRESGGANRIVVSMWMDPCLAIHTTREWNVLCQDLLRVRNGDREFRRFKGALISKAEELELDKQGRILLPPHLREYAGIKRDVTIAGEIERLLIWDSERYAEWYDLDDDKLSELNDRYLSAQETSPAGGMAPPA